MSDHPATGESELRRKVARLLDLGPKRGVSVLVAEEEKQCSCLPAQDLETVIQALCAQGSPWVGEFKKRERRVKRCPPALRSAIAVALKSFANIMTPGTRVAPTDVVRRAREPKSSGTLEIRDKEELGFGPKYGYFLAQLHTLVKQPLPIELHVEFDCDFVYVHGLAMLAAWCERYAAGVALSAKEEGVTRYLIDTGFREVVEKGVSIKSPQYDKINHVALTRIDRHEAERADDVAARIAELFVRHGSVNSGMQTPLTIVFAELVENVYRHARSNYGAYVMAQAFPETKKLHLVVADTGLGLLATFRESKDIALRSRAKSDKDAIDLALERLVTSKTEQHAGYGLYLVRRLAERNGGEFRIVSGTARKVVSPFVDRLRRAKRFNSRFEKNLPWRGTEVSAIFDLNNPVPLEEVYRELGPLNSPEDFFD